MHISPNAAIAGKSSVGEGGHIGIGSSVIDSVSICAGVKVGAGAVITGNITAPGLYVGIPAHKIRK